MTLTQEIAKDLRGKAKSVEQQAEEMRREAAKLRAAANHLAPTPGRPRKAAP